MVRYPEFRPEGLVVDASGKIALTNLMSTWAKSQGLQEKDILETVQVHMWQDREVRALRYSLLEEEGAFYIRVHPSKKESRAPETQNPRSYWLVKSEDRRPTKPRRFQKPKQEPFKAKQEVSDVEEMDAKSSRNPYETDQDEEDYWMGYKWADNNDE